VNVDKSLDIVTGEVALLINQFLEKRQA